MCIWNEQRQHTRDLDQSGRRSQVGLGAEVEKRIKSIQSVNSCKTWQRLRQIPVTTPELDETPGRAVT